MSKIIATFFYSGHIKPAPGTWGSLAALPTAFLIASIGGWTLLLATAVATYFIGLWATKAETQGADDHDPSEIVIDEVVGQWVALLPVVYGAHFASVGLLALWPGWLAAFALFRFFDITKLGPVGWADRRNDAVGVMLDDVIAGVFAAVGVILLGILYHVVMF